MNEPVKSSLTPKLLTAEPRTPASAALRVTLDIEQRACAAHQIDFLQEVA